MKGRLLNASQKLVIQSLNADLHLDSGPSLEKIDKFCYLGDVLDADGECDSAVTASQICLEKVP